MRHINEIKLPAWEQRLSTLSEIERNDVIYRLEKLSTLITRVQTRLQEQEEVP